MSDCCSSSKCTPSHKNMKHSCPVNGKLYSKVSAQTLLKHIKKPWNYKLSQEDFYFCDDPDCDVVYFGQDNSMINQSDLRTKVGVKDISETAIICYCFGVTKSGANRDPNIKNFVIEQTKNNICACESMNPSGKCCLKDF